MTGKTHAKNIKRPKARPQKQKRQGDGDGERNGAASDAPENVPEVNQQYPLPGHPYGVDIKARRSEQVEVNDLPQLPDAPVQEASAPEGLEGQNKPEKGIHCPDCDMWLNGPTQWEDHKIGKKHAKNIKRSKAGRPKQKRQGDGDGEWNGVAADAPENVPEDNQQYPLPGHPFPGHPYPPLPYGYPYLPASYGCPYPVPPYGVPGYHHPDAIVPDYSLHYAPWT